MDETTVYLAGNEVQRKNVYDLLENYFPLLKWTGKMDETVVDIGCGPGDVTANMLFPRLPKNVKKVVGIDISKNMVDYATEHYSGPNVFFQEMDISTDKIPNDFQEAFDHVFSFHCFHWIPNQSKAFTNVFKIMKPGADLLMLMVNYQYDIELAVTKKERWNCYREQFQRYVTSPQYEQLLKDVGFENCLCIPVQKTYEYPDMVAVIDFVKGVLSVHGIIPLSLTDDFIGDYMKEAEKTGFVQHNHETNGVRLNYKVLNIFARKSSAQHRPPELEL